MNQAEERRLMAEEEAMEVGKGQHFPHKVTAAVFVKMGLDLEEQQYVNQTNLQSLLTDRLQTHLVDLCQPKDHPDVYRESRPSGEAEQLEASHRKVEGHPTGLHAWRRFAARIGS